ncbi:MAG: hypothetical protein HY537_09060 [Deltaproteobacteria bacterium]|nr:hypothetical protein [Deltaproteobacteria bacterium]
MTQLILFSLMVLSSAAFPLENESTEEYDAVFDVSSRAEKPKTTYACRAHCLMDTRQGTKRTPVQTGIVARNKQQAEQWATHPLRHACREKASLAGVQIWKLPSLSCEAQK